MITKSHPFHETRSQLRISCLMLLTIVASFLLSATPIVAAQPQVNIVNPPGLQRGTSTEIHLSGARLGDAKQVLFYTPGLEATNFSVVDDNNIKVTVNATAEATCDLHAFRVVTATGIANLRYLGVSPFATVSEAEPNSEFSSPQSIPIPSTVNGVVLSEDVDYFAVDVSKGTLLTVELEGLRHAYMSNFFDPFVAILDAKRFELSRSDDSPLLQQDCVCSVVAPEDGRYWIEVRESSFGGSGECLYRLHVGSFARPLAVHPSGGPPGQPLQATLIDGLGNSWQETFAIPDSRNDRFKIWATKDGQSLPSPNVIRVNAMTNVIESEPNIDYNTQPVHSTFPIAFNGILQTKEDRDWFVIAAKKDQQLEIRLFGRNTLRSPIDAVVEIVKVNGPYIAGVDDSGGPDSILTFKAPEDGNYAISVRDHLGSGGPTYAYRLEVESPNPYIEVTVTEQERYLSQTIEVPRGARMAVEANLIRKFIGGEGRIVIEDLPTGLSQAEAVVQADLGNVPVLLRAAADSANLGKLVDLIGRISVNPESTVVGHLNQRSQLIRGQNSIDVWGHNSDRLAVAITEPAPFDIEVIQPQVPLVRDGTLPLKIRAKRNEGFKNPINVYLLYAPPGVAAPGSTSIPGDQTEIDLPLTANGGAAIRQWPVTVLASADTGRGVVKIASEFVTLDVADRLFEFQFTKHMVEQGKASTISVGAKLTKPTEGTVEVELLGIPPGITVPIPKQSLAAGIETLNFAIEVAADAKPGNHKTMVCRGTITSDKGTITQVNGIIELQIDVPLPAPKSEPPTAAPVPVPDAAMAAEKPPEKPPEKPLTRLEQLRKQRDGKK